MKISVVLILLLFTIKANGNQTEITTTELGIKISTEAIDQDEAATTINKSEASTTVDESELATTTEEIESNTLTYEQKQFNRYNDELDQILYQKLENYTNLKILPNFYGRTTDVIADVEIREILGISEVDMHMRFNLVMDLHWEDLRLRYEHVKQDDGTQFENNGVWVDDSVKEKIWIPTVSILNEKESTDHSVGFVQENLLWYPDGEFIWRINLITTVSCSMSLQDFPMDEQNCSILIGSPNYLDHELRLHLRTYLHPIFSSSVTNVKLLGWRVSPLVHTGDGANRTTYAYELLLRRYVGYYVIGTFFPSALVVFISWLTFWMARDAAGERMALGVTCVLTITTLLISSQASSPKVSYIKAIDIYMGVCFTLVFTTLLQSTVVGYLLRKLMRNQEATRRSQQNNGRSNNGAPRSFASVVRRVVAGDLEANEEPKIIKFMLRCDIWCRLIYPVIFLGFNVAYWTLYLSGSKFDASKGWNLPTSYAIVLDGRQ